MFNIRFSVVNPYHKENFEVIFLKWGPITKHKMWSFEVYKNSSDIFLFDLDISWRGQDHAGPSFLFGLLSYFIHVKIYDIRHWDYGLKQWNNNEECDKKWT